MDLGRLEETQVSGLPLARSVRVAGAPSSGQDRTDDPGRVSDLPEVEERPRVGEVGQDNVRTQAGQFPDGSSSGCYERATYADFARAGEVAWGVSDYPHLAKVRLPPGCR